MRVRTLLPCLGVSVLIAGGSIRGEVAARVDENGVYQCMSYRYSAQFGSGRIWSVGATSPNRRPLNPNGDRFRDLAPTVIENAANENWPMVVWSHPSGGDFDLTFSQWTRFGWSPIRYIHSDNGRDDLEPRLAHNLHGDVYLIWWSSGPGSSASVSFSYFTRAQGRWSPRHLVSDAGVDSRRAEITIVEEARIQVRYQTPVGPELRDIQLSRLDTITDDIDPRYRVTVSDGRR